MGMMWVTPSPESMTVPVSPIFFCSESSFALCQALYIARVAWTPMCRPSTPKVSNMISAMDSRFCGGFIGGSVSMMMCSRGSQRRKS